MILISAVFDHQSGVLKKSQLVAAGTHLYVFTPVRAGKHRISGV